MNRSESYSETLTREAASRTAQLERMGAARRVHVQATCEGAGDNHSLNIMRVWHGTSTPRVLCGYHAMREGFTS